MDSSHPQKTYDPVSTAGLLSFESVRSLLADDSSITVPASVPTPVWEGSFPGVSSSSGSDFSALSSSGLESMGEDTGAEERILITVALSCSAAGAGAEKTFKAVGEYLLAQHCVNAVLLPAGSDGFLSGAPVLSIRFPGRTALVYHRITPEKVPSLLSALFSAVSVSGAGQRFGEPLSPPAESLFGQKRDPLARPWEGVPFLEDHPFYSGQVRVLSRDWDAVNASQLFPVLSRGGYRAFARAVHLMTPSEVCAELEAAGLRGRGGAGFPTGRKWRAVLNARSSRKYVVCNADEGDPCSLVDRALLENSPHLVLEGLAIAAYACGASRGCVYLRPENTLAFRRLEEALQELRGNGLLGENILDSGFDLKIVIRKSGGAFVCGEESALIAGIEGRRAMPSPRPPYPSERGLYGKPTAVNNVETLAQVPGILFGASFQSTFSSGRDSSGEGGGERTADRKEDRPRENHPGPSGRKRGFRNTKLFSLSGDIARPGIIEVPMGITLREIVYGIGGGVTGGRSCKAVQIGGPSGGFIPGTMLDTPVGYESLRAAGAMMGSGGIVVMNEQRCMVDAACFFTDFMYAESCGKCVPCREGMRQMRALLHGICEGDGNLRRQGKGVTEKLERLARVIRRTSLCGLGRTAANPVLSTLRHFREEYEEHLSGNFCRCGVCRMNSAEPAAEKEEEGKS